MANYLADTSIWSWYERNEKLRQKFEQRFGEGQILTCGPVILEHMHLARDGNEYERHYNAFFNSIICLKIDDRCTERALEVQRALAAKQAGAHRIQAIDYIIAATAELVKDGVVLWHTDRDFLRICDITGQSQEYEEISA